MPKVAAIQMCSSNDIDKNLTDAMNLINEAKEEGAKLVVLPEMFPVMGKKPSDKLMFKEDYGSGKVQSFLSKIAKKKHIWIVAGTIPIASYNENKIKAASIVYNDKGEPLARYDKIHLFDVKLNNGDTYFESDTTDQGDKVITVNSPIGVLGLSVCYDIRFSLLYSKLFDNGAQIITIPSAFTVETGKAHWEVLVKARAIEFQAYVIAACQVGTHPNGRKTYGHSMIVDPWGEILAEAEYPNQGVICANIDMAKLESIRTSIPVRNHKFFFANQLCNAL